jgi:starvation-inducible DNA-binding protein
MSAKTRKAVCETLNVDLAVLTDLYSQTKQAHWNVRGPEFFYLHKLFDQLAETVEQHIDPLAERITALGGKTHGTVRQAAQNSPLEEFPDELPNALAFVDALIDRYAAAAKQVRSDIGVADEQEDDGTADLLTAVSRDLDQSLWFLEAHKPK